MKIIVLYIICCLFALNTMTFYKDYVKEIPSTNGEFWTVGQFEKYFRDYKDNVVADGVIPHRKNAIIVVKVAKYNYIGDHMGYTEKKFDSNVQRMGISYCDSRCPRIFIQTTDWEDRKHYPTDTLIKVDIDWA